MMKTYRLAKENQFAVVPFGPMFTLEKAESYRDQMKEAGFNVLVVNMAEGIDLPTHGKRKGWNKSSLLTV